MAHEALGRWKKVSNVADRWIDPASPGLVVKSAIDKAITTCILQYYVKRELY